jgi:hypothetical protein
MRSIEHFEPNNSINHRFAGDKTNNGEPFPHTKKVVNGSQNLHNDGKQLGFLF